MTAGLFVWGAAYLVRCVDVLRQPRLPLAVKYEASGGEHIFRAESFTWNPWDLTADLSGVTLGGPGGTTLARAESATAAVRKGVVSVETVGLSVHLIRERDGSFNLSAAIPPKQPSAKPPTVVFHAERVRVAYTDLTRSEVLEEPLTLSKVDLAQGESGTLVTSRLTFSEQLPVVATAQLGPSGEFWLQLSDVSLEASHLLPVAERFVDPAIWRKWGVAKCTNLGVSGQVEVAKAPNAPVYVGGRLHVVSDQITVANGLFAGRANVEIEGSLGATNLRAQLADRSTTLNFTGACSLGSEPEVSGRFAVSLPDSSPLSRFQARLPSDVAFHTAKATGYVSYSRGRASLSGTATVASATVKGETLRQLAGRFSYSDEDLAIAVDRSSWRGSSLNGALETNLKSGALSAVVRLDDSSLAQALRPFGVDWIQGHGKARAAVTGTVSKPVVEVLVDGYADVHAPGQEPVNGGPFEARLRADQQGARLSRFTLSGPNGLVAAEGSADWKSKRVAGTFLFGAVPLQTVSKATSGTLFARGSVSGTTDQPHYSARVEGYGLEYQKRTIAQVVGSVHGDKESLDVDSLRALSGTGALSGQGSVDWKSHKINGRFEGQNMSLSEWLGSDFLGTVNVRNGSVTGTLEDPRIEANADGRRLSAYGTIVREFTAKGRVTAKQAELESATLTIGDGHATFSGTYAFETKVGTVDGRLDAVPLERLAPPKTDLDLVGKLDGTLSGRIDGDNWKGAGKLSVSGVAVNKTPLGAGDIEVDADKNRWSVKGDVGSVDRFLSVSDLTYSTEDRSLDAKVAAYNLKLRDLIAATKPYWSAQWTQPPDWFEDTDGSFSGSAQFSAIGDDWEVDDSDMAIDGLVIAGRDAGKLTAKLQEKGKKWSVPSVTWIDGESSFQGGGSYDESGQVEANGNLTDFDLSWIKAFLPDTPLVTGKASATVVASGPHDDLSGRASLFVDHAVVTYAEGQRTSPPVQLLLDDVSFGHKTLSATGKTNFAGFTGSISADVPYSALAPSTSQEARRPLSAKLLFEERPIQDFRNQFPDFDFDASTGKVDLSATVQGFLDELNISASASLKCPRLVSKSIDTNLQDVSVEFSQKDRRASLSMSAKSSRGGSVLAHISANLAHVFGSDFDVDALLDDSTVQGSASAEAFTWLQRLPGAKDPTVGRVSGTLDVSGSLRSPVIKGDIGFGGVVVNLPQDVTSGTAPSFWIDPKFDVLALTVEPGSRIESGLGPLVVRGDGRLTGTLSQPDLNLPLTLQSGSFRLPSGKITLEPGGRILFSYASVGGGEPLARADIDLEGRTTVISKRAGGNYEPFQVTLGIHGNAMDDKSVRLTAFSDPPDLSQDEILAIIGQRDLITGLAQGVLGGTQESAFWRDTFYSLAVPNLTQSVTQGLASGLKLDYLSVDYNPFDQFMVSAGKTLTKGLMLQVSRQLQETPTGPLRYEVKLLYRLPTSDRFFSRVRLGLGFDQTVPWKFSVGWSTRF